MNQELWNLLFSWSTGRQCMLPEGCSAPLDGMLIYIGLVALLGGLIYIERGQLVAMTWRK